MGEENKELFWEASIEEVKKGFIEEAEQYKCIICEESFTKGQIYPIDDKFFDAKKAVELHIEKQHGSTLAYLLGMNNGFTGVSGAQLELLKLMAAGLSDKEIAAKLEVAPSTIRNHRYKLREKEKQARLFLAMMELIASNTKKDVSILEQGILCDAHKTATTLDDRYNITDKERETTIKNYMNANGTIKTYPAKEKRKIIILSEIVKNFAKGKQYSEKEINRILERIYEDYATIRRALIEYGFIERSSDCTTYWVRE